MRTRVKICGITRAEDALAAAHAGCDAIGLVFCPSPRRVTLEQARQVLDVLPPFIARVGLFMDSDPEWIRQVLGSLSLDLLQFHGEESPEDCQAFGRDYIKAVPMGSRENSTSFMARYPQARGFVLDSHAQGAAGGTGRSFDWSLWPSGVSAPLMLAGGLNPDNVAEAILRTRPWAVDVSSGVESSPGIKDPSRMQRFISEVRRVDREQA